MIQGATQYERNLFLGTPISRSAYLPEPIGRLVFPGCAKVINETRRIL